MEERRRDPVAIWPPTVNAAPDAVDEADIEEIKSVVLAKLTLAVGKDRRRATDRDWFVATALALRDRIIHRWLAVDRASRARGPQARLLSVAGIPDRPAVRRCGRQSAADRNRSTPRSAISASISTGCAAPSPTPRSAMAASAGSPPASWRAWRASASRPTAMASATTTGCSAR